jgi:hypothetical protein
MYVYQYFETHVLPYHLIFSVWITSGLNNEPKINKGFVGAPTSPLQHKIEENRDILFINTMPTGEEKILLRSLLKYVKRPTNFLLRALTQKHSKI